MRINKTNNVSFKNIYSIKGQTEILDEICWYMGKKIEKFSDGFDFMAIRNGLIVPTSFLGRGDSCDLFLTMGHKKKFENKIPLIVRDMVENDNSVPTLKAKIDKISDVSDYLARRVSGGKPLKELSVAFVTEYLSKLIDSKQLKLLEASDVFEKIKMGNFDIITGNEIKKV